MKKYLTIEEKQEILEKSDRFTSKQLAEQYECSRSEILKIWMDNNYHKPRGFSYYVDNNYFSNIDTANKAYIVGLVASDGNVYKRDGHDGQLRFCFQNGDSEYNLLANILLDMQATHPIRKNTKTSNDKTLEYISATIVSQQIFEDLCDIGIVPQKTWLLDIVKILNHIPQQFVRDFLRGYFDGDGCITGMSSNIPSGIFAHIAMPLESANLLQEYLSSLGIQALVTKDNRIGHYKNPFGRLDFHSANKYIFLKWIYYTNCLCLQRKYNLAATYCALVESNATNRKENIVALCKYEDFLLQNKIIEEV